MKTYALIENGGVAEIIAPLVLEGKEIPLADRYHPDFVAKCVDVTGVTPPPAPGDLYAAGKFSRPAGPSFAEIQADALRQIDADVDAIYAALIGNRQEEYNTAEREAQAYRDAGYSGTVPGSVQAWATAKKWTAKQAADDILATSAAWRAAQADIRANRLARKEDVRNAKDPASVDAVMTTWATYAAKTRAALGA